MKSILKERQMVGGKVHEAGEDVSSIGTETELSVLKAHDKLMPQLEEEEQKEEHPSHEKKKYEEHPKKADK
jgi:hypothetical protein